MIIEAENTVSAIADFHQINQGHIFDHLQTLSQETQQILLNQALSIDLTDLASLIKNLSFSQTQPISPQNLTPPSYIPLPQTPSQNDSWHSALLVGEEAIKSGRVAAFVAAGGMGTRLDASIPKGLFQVTPIKKKTLFQVFAEKIKIAEQRYQTTIPWFIMTSQGNHHQIKDFFANNNHFGLAQVFFFNQDQMPLIDHDHKMVINNEGLIEMSPDGHGGSFNALLKSGAIEKMKALGVDIITYFQVDNPLIHCIDPHFIGFYLLANSQMASKMVKKILPSEKVGLFCQDGPSLKIIEYSNAPDSLINKTTPDGHLAFHAGNVAAHIIDRDFIHTLASNNQLPFHPIKKTINGSEFIKFEQFIFDALVLAKNPIILETSRQTEFSPIKNAQGPDSPASCIQDQLRLFKTWLEKADVDIKPLSKSTSFPIEISPLFADTEATFLKKWASLDLKPIIQAGIYLEY